MAHAGDELIFDPCSNGGPLLGIEPGASAHLADDPPPLALFCEDAAEAGVVRGAPKYEIKEEEGLGDPVGEKGK